MEWKTISSVRMGASFRKTQTHPRVQEYMAQNDMLDEYLVLLCHFRLAIPYVGHGESEGRSQ